MVKTRAQTHAELYDTIIVQREERRGHMTQVQLYGVQRMKRDMQSLRLRMLSSSLIVVVKRDTFEALQFVWNLVGVHGPSVAFESPSTTEYITIRSEIIPHW